MAVSDEAVIRVGFGMTLLCRGLRTGGIDGIGRYTLELSKALSARSDVALTPFAFGEHIPPELSPQRSIKLPGAFPAMAALSVVTGFAFPRASHAVIGIDLVHAPDHLVPRLSGVPVIATLMDAIPLSHPEWVSSRLRSLKNAVWKRTARWAERIVTISEYSRLDIAEHFRLPVERISVVPLGVDERWFHEVSPGCLAEVTSRLQLPERFFLFVGTLQPRKNLQRVIDAHLALPEAVRRDAPLLIVGRAGWQCDDLVRALAAGRHGASVRWLRHLPDDDLLAVMKQATALVFPSLCEGFGLPVLEAFAAGTPVITSSTTALPEAAGDAALLVDPRDTSAIAAAMAHLYSNPELAILLRSRGVRRAREFTWQRTAAMTVDVYRRVSAG